MTTTRGSLRSGPVDLAVADIERDDAASAALEKDVREAAGRGADIQASRSSTAIWKVSRAWASFTPAPADVRMIGCDESDVGRRINLGAGFGFRLAIDADLACQDQGACALSRRREASFDDQLIQPNAQFLQP
jgi:hypothetical protein